MILKSLAVLFVILHIGAEGGPTDKPSGTNWYKTIKQPSWETEDTPAVVVVPNDGPTYKPSEAEWYKTVKQPSWETEDTPVGVVSTGVMTAPNGNQQPPFPMGVYVAQTIIFGSTTLNGTQGDFANGGTVISREDSEFTYDDAAGGWLKYHKKASWPIALMTCQAEGAILASPVSTQVRDAIERLVSRKSQSEGTIHAGVQARAGTNDFFSVEGIDLKNMPVNIEFGSIDKSSKCVKWMTSQREVTFSNCQEELPFFCLKNKKKQATVGCGLTDPEYKYDERSGSCYKMHVKSVTWRNANRMCKKEGGHLAIVNSELENKILKEIYEKHPNSEITNSRWECVLMGMLKSAGDGLWWTTQGQELEESGFPGWDPSQPNNVGENCACMYRIGTFHDISCDIPLAYICEKKAELLS